MNVSWLKFVKPYVKTCQPVALQCKRLICGLVCACVCHVYSTLLYLVFAIVLGATCTREALQTDYLIAEKVRNAFRFSSGSAVF